MMLPVSETMARGTGLLETDAQTAARRLVGHLRYQQYRPRSLGEQRADRWVFSATADRVRQAGIRAAVLAPGCLQVVLHTFLLAPPAAARVRDYRAWARAWVAERERECLCWFGVLHHGDQDINRPHVHVGLVHAQVTSPRLLQGQRGLDHAACLSAGYQGGVLLRLPQIAKKESC